MTLIAPIIKFEYGHQFETIFFINYFNLIL